MHRGTNKAMYDQQEKGILWNSGGKDGVKMDYCGRKKHEILNAGASLGVVAYLWVQTC